LPIAFTDSGRCVIHQIRLNAASTKTRSRKNFRRCGGRCAGRPPRVTPAAPEPARLGEQQMHRGCGQVRGERDMEPAVAGAQLGRGAPELPGHGAERSARTRCGGSDPPEVWGGRVYGESSSGPSPTRETKPSSTLTPRPVLPPSG
jgi:hypothetical protein